MTGARSRSGEVAIIGAGGFVGSRMVESLLLAGESNFRAIVRAYRSFAGTCRFGPDVNLVRADAEDLESLERAISDCATVVNLTTGSPASIRRSTKVIYEACVRAKVPRLVHLSSAVVYGDVALPDTHDDSRPLTDHWMPYARAKAYSERWLRQHAMAGPCEIITLRPGIIWGPHSPHTLGIAQALVGRSAYLVDGGRAVFNGIYIDNLVAAILTSHRHPEPVRGFYNVSDQEHVTWSNFYAAFGSYLDCDVGKLPVVTGRRFSWSVPSVVDYVQNLPVMNQLYHRLKKRLPDGLRAKLKQMLSGRGGYEERASRYAKRPRIERELWYLQKTRHKLPSEKFARRFGFTPPISFEEGVRRTARWLAYLGFGCADHTSCENNLRP